MYLSAGTGKITVNKREIDDFFGMETLKMIIRQPFGVTGTEGKYDVTVFVRGGGYTGQAGATQGCTSCSAVQQALIETKRHAKNPGNSTFLGFFLSKIFLNCFDKTPVI